MQSSLVVVGRFVRIVKGDGTLLFRPALRDAEFLGQAKHLYHHLFGTEFGVGFIKPVAKGFHVRIDEVERPYEAEYLVGEEFALPREEIAGRTLDALLGLPVVTGDGKKLGAVTDIVATPAYPLLTVRGAKKSFDIPFTPAVTRLDGDRIVLLREEISG